MFRLTLRQQRAEENRAGAERPCEARHVQRKWEQTDESLTAWIEDGDQLMPPFKDLLDSGQIKDVIAYVKTL
jgi:hypothetical protein